MAIKICDKAGILLLLQNDRVVASSTHLKSIKKQHYFPSKRSCKTSN